MLQVFSPKASLCRREAGEREKTTRAGDDGKGKLGGATAEERFASLVMPPTMGCPVVCFRRF